jgi:hypothetical protein
MNATSRKPWWKWGAAIALAVTVALCLIPRDITKCDVPLAYVEFLGGDQYALKIRKRDQVRQVTTLRTPVSYDQIVGYDAHSRTWVCGSQGHAKLAAIRDGRCKPTKLQGVGHRIYDLALANGRLIVAYDHGDTVAVGAFNLDGRLLSEHVLQTPRSWSPHPDISEEVAVSSSGEAAASLVPVGSKHSDFYMYDITGKEVAHRDKGIGLHYDPSGRFLTYDDCDWVADYHPNGELASIGTRGPGSCIILDLKSRKKQVIPGFDRWVISGGVPSKVGGPNEIRWAPGGRWLITDCEPNPLGTGMAVSTRCVFALDLRAKRLQWRRMYDLPWVDWTPVDDGVFAAAYRR